MSNWKGMVMARLKLHINGDDAEVEAKETALLLDVLRERLEMTGTKRGCETSHCGACSKCRERHDAFLEAAVADPTQYVDTAYVNAS